MSEMIKNIKHYLRFSAGCGTPDARTLILLQQQS